MTAPVEILLWAPSQAVFAATMDGLRLPDGRRIAWLATEEMPPAEATNSICTIDEVGCSEIDVMVKRGTITDEAGNEVEVSTVVPGYHANLVAYGWLAELLTAGLPAEGTLFERTRILSLLGQMDWQPSAVGEPAGYVGASGVKIFDPAGINQRAREWA